MNNIYILKMIIVMAVAMLILRFLPFIFLSKINSKTLMKLGNILPSAIVAMLVIYCLKDVEFVLNAKLFATLIGVLVTLLLQIFKRNMLISIIGGTFCYMLILQII